MYSTPNFYVFVAGRLVSHLAYNIDENKNTLSITCVQHFIILNNNSFYYIFSTILNHAPTSKGVFPKLKAILLSKHIQ